jgi:hypothetical protein
VKRIAVDEKDLVLRREEGFLKPSKHNQMKIIHKTPG